MTTYYVQENNEIIKATPFEKVAKTWGTYETTDKEIVYGWNGKLYFADAVPSVPEPTYIEKRLAEYPSVGDQLDMIYWDQINNTNIWQTTISAIKAKYPKP